MADRDQKISVYVTEDRKTEIERKAATEDMTISSYLNRLISRQLAMEAENEIASTARAADQLQTLIDRGTRQLRDATEDLQEMNAKMGVYTIANFELMKGAHGQPEIRDALSTGSRRLRDDLDFGAELAEASETTDLSRDSSEDDNDDDNDGNLVDRVRDR